MTVIEVSRQHGLVGDRRPDVDIVVPVYNESAQVEASIRTLSEFVNREFPLAARITIADNASTDDTWARAVTLADTLVGVRAIHLDEKGRGRALRAAWLASDATVVAYLDVDLSTGLDALLPLVAPLVSGHSDVAIGTRLAPGSRVVRGPLRELISRGYNALVHLVLRGRFSDAQCGFKALRAEAARMLLPLVEDQEWFFDTELLVVAERVGLRIHEVPVDWVDDPDSRVDILRTIRDDLRGVWRVAHRRTPLPWRASGQATSAELLRFAGVGVMSTFVYLGAFAILWPLMGSFAANSVSVLACGLSNAAVHRRLAGRQGGLAQHLAGTAALTGVSLAFTTLALVVAQVLFSRSLPTALVAVSIANAAAAVVRFFLLRNWVFRPAFRSVRTSAPGSSGPAEPPVGAPVRRGA